VQYALPAQRFDAAHSGERYYKSKQMKLLILAATAAILLSGVSAADAQSYRDYKDRAYNRFCKTRGGCYDHDATMKMLDAKDNARRTIAEDLNAQKRERAEATAHAAREASRAAEIEREQARLAADAERQKAKLSADAAHNEVKRQQEMARNRMAVEQAAADRAAQQQRTEREAARLAQQAEIDRAAAEQAAQEAARLAEPRRIAEQAAKARAEAERATHEAARIIEQQRAAEQADKDRAAAAVQQRITEKRAAAIAEKIEIIKRKCAGEWSDDFRMRRHCEDRQFEALQSLIDRGSIKP
jgi:hypothetical protein